MKKLVSILLIIGMLAGIFSVCGVISFAEANDAAVAYGAEEKCTCICHSDSTFDSTQPFYSEENIKAIINMVMYRVELLMWRLFAVNKVCECGRWHY